MSEQGEKTTGRPMPVPSAETKPFWEAVGRHELRLPRCATCDILLYPPPPRCPECLSDDLVWTELSGRASLMSWTVVHIDLLPGVDPPFVIGEAELEEQPGLVMVAHVVGVPADQLRSDMSLRVSYVDVQEVALPQFEALGSESHAAVA